MAASPKFFDLFGPIGGLGFTGTVGPNWWWLTALTASTKNFRFDLDYPPAVEARFLVIWTPNNIASACRLVAFDDGPANTQEILLVTSQGDRSPVIGWGEIKIPYNALVANRVRKHLGFQMRDNGVNAWTLYNVRLEIHEQRP